MPRLHQFRARHPNIEIRLSAPDSPVAFARDDIDVSIRVGRGVSRRIGCPVCSPSLLQSNPLATPDDLRHHTLLHMASRHDAWHEWLRLTGVTSVDPTTGQRFDTFYFLLQAAVSSFGVAMGPKPLVTDDLASGRLIAPFGFVPNSLAMYVLYPKAYAHHPQIIAFLSGLAGRRGGLCENLKMKSSGFVSISFFHSYILFGCYRMGSR